MEGLGSRPSKVWTASAGSQPPLVREVLEILFHLFASDGTRVWMIGDVKGEGIGVRNHLVDSAVLLRPQLPPVDLSQVRPREGV